MAAKFQVHMQFTTVHCSVEIDRNALLYIVQGLFFFPRQKLIRAISRNYDIIGNGISRGSE